MREVVHGIGGAGNLFEQCVFRRCPDVLAKVAYCGATPQGYAAGIRHDVACDDLEKSSLANTIPANDRDAVAHADGETDPAEKFAAGIGLRNIGDTKHIFILPLSL